MTEQSGILLVEDDPAQRLLLAAYLQQTGLPVLEAGSVTEAQTLLREALPRLVVLDLNLPDGDGFALARELRQRELPLVIVSCREGDRIEGLELGVDDYITKPYNPRELVARVNNVLRRCRTAPAKTPCRFGSYHLDPARRVLADGAGRTVELTRGEFDLLAELAAARGQVLSRTELAEAINPDGEPSSSRSVDVLVSRLRQKLEMDPRSPRLLLTAPGHGYRLDS